MKNKVTLKEIPDINLRGNYGWRNRMIPHDITQGYWPTPGEFENLIYGVVQNKDRLTKTQAKIGKDSAWRIYVRWGKMPFYEWMHENFLEYCDNYKKEITYELLEEAYFDFEDQIAIPWLETDEAKIPKEDFLEYCRNLSY